MDAILSEHDWDIAVVEARSIKAGTGIYIPRVDSHIRLGHQARWPFNGFALPLGPELERQHRNHGQHSCDHAIHCKTLHRHFLLPPCIRLSEECCLLYPHTTVL